MKIERVDNGLAVRLPEDMVERLGLHEGDEVRLSVEKAQRPLTDAERKDLIDGLRKFQGRMPPGFKFDRDEANAR